MILPSRFRNANYLLLGSVVESAITALRLHYCSCKFHCRINETVWF